jgi:hypothetical protein
MVRIAISAEAFEAIARTLPLGSVGFENEANERGERLIWLEGRDGGPARRDAGSRRELQQRHSQAGRVGGRVRPIAWLGRGVLWSALPQRDWNAF